MKWGLTRVTAGRLGAGMARAVEQLEQVEGSHQAFEFKPRQSRLGQVQGQSVSAGGQLPG